MVVDEARQQVAQLQEEALARDVGVGIHVEGRGEAIVEVEEQAHLGVVERRGRGMATALRPEESMAQQSEQPSVIQSGSPGRRRSSTGWL